MNWLDIDTGPEKLRFGVSVASLCVMYMIPQIACFYVFARLFVA